MLDNSSRNLLRRLRSLLLFTRPLLRCLIGFRHLIWRRILALGWGRLFRSLPYTHSTPSKYNESSTTVVTNNNPSTAVINSGGEAYTCSVAASVLPAELHIAQIPSWSDRNSQYSYEVQVDSPVSMHGGAELSSHSKDTSETITLNDLSLQRISLVPGTGQAVVTPYASVADLGHERAGSHMNRSQCSSQDEISPVIYPIMPIDIPRYTRERLIKPKPARYRIRSREGDFSPGELPAGWKQLIHPEGQPFFHHEEKNILTEVWLWDPTFFRILTEFIDHIEDFVRSRNLHRPPKVQLVLELKEDSEDKVYWCGYYFADPERRSLFWLEEFIITQYVKEVKGELSPSHIKIYLETQYWKHWETFCNIQPATLQVLDLVTDTIRDAQTDILTSNDSTINHSFVVLKSMMSIVKDSRVCVMNERECSSWFVGRFMSMLWNDRFLNFHGQYGARLSRKQSVHGYKPEDKRHSNFMKYLSPVLFCAPDVHLTTMEELWVDKLTLKLHWTEFFTKLNNEWCEHTAFATILLNANVAFLAIPSNDSSNDYSSPVQIASYLSIVTSVSSILLGLVLVRQHRTREKGSAPEVASFLKKRNHPTRGLETLAIMYSLPYALLMWAMVTFLIAFSIMCFQSTSIATRSTIGVAWILNAALVLWCIQMSWEESEKRWWHLFSQIWARIIGIPRKLLRIQERDDNEESETDSMQQKTDSGQTSGHPWRRFWPPRKTLSSSQPSVSA